MHVMLPESSPSSRGPGIATPAGLLPSVIAPHLRSLSSTGITRRLQSYGPLRHPDRPSLPLTGFRLVRATPPTGLPVLLPSPSSMRAAANTPAGPAGALVAHFPASASLPQRTGGSAPAFQVSRPAQRSLALRPAWSLDHPRRPVTPKCFERCRYLHHPLRLLPAGATVCRAGFAPAEGRCLSTAHVESGAGAPTLGSGGDSGAFVPGLSPAPIVTFPAPALRTRRADFRHRALQWDHAPRTRTARAIWACRWSADAARLPLCIPTDRASRVAPIPLFHACRRQYPGGTSRCACRSLPGQWQPSPTYRRVGSRIPGFEACSAFTRVAARMVAGSP